MFKKLFLSVVAVALCTGVAYAGCFNSQVTNKPVDGSNMRRTVLQCIAQRAGGTWAISSGDTYMTQGSTRITTLKPVDYGSGYSMDVLRGETLLARVTFPYGGYYADIRYGSEIATCTIVWVGVANNPPMPPTLHEEVRYCR
jgi:hypothetical protein